MENETKVVLTVTISLAGLGGLLVSVLWVYVSKQTLNDDRLTNQTYTVISNITHIFIANLAKSICGLTCVLCWIWLFYNSPRAPGFIVCYWLITMFIVLESFQLTLVAVNRLNCKWGSLSFLSIDQIDNFSVTKTVLEMVKIFAIVNCCNLNSPVCRQFNARMVLISHDWCITNIISSDMRIRCLCFNQDCGFK